MYDLLWRNVFLLMAWNQSNSLDCGILTYHAVLPGIKVKAADLPGALAAIYLGHMLM
jgi:hypothetical protein